MCKRGERLRTTPFGAAAFWMAGTVGAVADPFIQLIEAVVEFQNGVLQSIQSMHDFAHDFVVMSLFVVVQFSFDFFGSSV
jgi:hypothetical protein